MQIIGNNLGFFLLLSHPAIFSYGLTINETLMPSWAFIQKTDILPYAVPLVHRPRSETPGDAVSEGVGYGLLASVFVDDKQSFDQLLEAADAHLWNGRWHDWRADEWGNVVATGAATDAEQDIAAALLLAQRKVDRGAWAEGTISYRLRAQQILDSMWDFSMITTSGNVAPGAGWGGDGFINPGYFAPLWYRLFLEEDGNVARHPWEMVIEKGYTSLRDSPGFERGLVPDWMTPNGGWVSNLGYNSYGDGRYLFKDAIRVFWRIGTDYLVSGDERARALLENAIGFLPELTQANFFTMEGQSVPCGDVWLFDGGQMERPRCEHSCLTVGMWSIVHHALGRDTRYFLTFFDETSGAWASDNYPNELYFEQFLALFAAITISGKWSLNP